VTCGNSGGWIESTSSAKPSVIACRTLPLNCACEPILTKYTGTPASEQMNCPVSAAVCALCSMIRSVCRAVWLDSRASAASSAARVSAGIPRNERSYNFAVTSLTSS
jgi:hypothetical protein